MNYTRVLHNQVVRLGVGLILLAAIFTVTLSRIGFTYASNDRPGDMGLDAPTIPQQQEADDRESEANLPYLFAVFIVTWAAFFAHVFVMSRRQREMQREIEALKMALAER